MTFADPNLVRNLRLTVRLHQYEWDLLQAMANFQGEQMSTLGRVVMVKEAECFLAAAVHEDSLGQRAA